MKLTRISLAIFILSIAFASATFAQKSTSKKAAFSKGQIDANIGIGMNMSSITNGMKAYMLPVGASIDYGISNKLSVGLNVGYGAVEMFIPNFKIRAAEATDDPSIIAPTKEQIMVIAARFAVHYNKFEKLDFYGGPILGMRYSLVSPVDAPNSVKTVFESEETEKKIAYGAFIGMRYHVFNNLGVFAELGAAHAAFQLGLNFKL